MDAPDDDDDDDAMNDITKLNDGRLLVMSALLQSFDILADDPKQTAFQIERREI